MPKPIFIVNVPANPYGAYSPNKKTDLNTKCKEIIKALSGEYYVFFVDNPDEDKFTFDIFSDSDIPQITLDEFC